MQRKKKIYNSAKVQPPVNVIAPLWSEDSYSSDAALYSSSSRDGTAKLRKIASLSSEYVRTDSFKEIERSKKQTKYVEQLLNYTESASLESSSHDARASDRSAQTDVAQADSASINEKNNKSRGIAGTILQWFMCCTYPEMPTEKEVKEPIRHSSGKRRPSAQGGDWIDRVFNGCESVVCHDDDDVVDHREHRILSPKRRPKKNHDMLDSVFESMESVVCRDDVTSTSRDTDTDDRDKYYCADPPGIHATKSHRTVPASQQKPSTDFLDSVCEGFESVICRDGPNGSYQPVDTDYKYDSSSKQHVRSHRGDWRGSTSIRYTIERDNSLVYDPETDQLLPGQCIQQQSDLKPKDTRERIREAEKQSDTRHRRDVLDFLCDGVEAMVCDSNRSESRFDEELPGRFVWDRQ